MRAFPPSSPAVGLRPAQMKQLPAQVLGRPAPAHRHRPRAGARARADRRRRAGVGARRLDPGPGDQPAAGPAARAPGSPTCSSRTISVVEAHQPSDRRPCILAGSLSSPTRGRSSRGPNIPTREASCRPCRCPTRRSAAKEAGRAGRRAEPGQTAARMPFPHPLPLRRGALQGRSTLSLPRNRTVPDRGG